MYVRLPPPYVYGEYLCQPSLYTWRGTYHLFCAVYTQKPCRQAGHRLAQLNGTNPHPHLRKNPLCEQPLTDVESTQTIAVLFLLFFIFITKPASLIKYNLYTITNIYIYIYWKTFPSQWSVSYLPAAALNRVLVLKSTQLSVFLCAIEQAHCDSPDKGSAAVWALKHYRINCTQ